MMNTVEPQTDAACTGEEGLLSRGRFLKVCIASIAGPLLLGLAGCGGSQDGGGGDGDEKKDDEDGGGGGGGGGGGY
jgi:hypothetical protein